MSTPFAKQDPVKPLYSKKTGNPFFGVAIDFIHKLSIYHSSVIDHSR
jgi:hypothetical protein